MPSAGKPGNTRVVREKARELMRLGMPVLEFTKHDIPKQVSIKDFHQNAKDSATANIGEPSGRALAEHMKRWRRQRRSVRLDQRKANEPLAYTVFKYPPHLVMYMRGDEDDPNCAVFYGWRDAFTYYRHRLKMELDFAVPRMGPGRFFTLKNGSNGDDYV